MQTEMGSDAVDAPPPVRGRRFLVVYATRHGSTKGIAEAIAKELSAAGQEVDLRPASETSEPARYDAVVIGGPMIRGWHKDALRFVVKHRMDLATRPTAFFITAASLTETGEGEVKGVPVVKDPWLAKRPRNKDKLGRKERYALPSHYLGDILAKVAPVRPCLAAFFAGSLDLATMGLLDKLFVLLVVGATPGDGRNWQAIREWARALPASMID